MNEMVINGTLLKMQPMMTSGHLRLTIEIDENMANEAFHRLGGFPKPGSPKMVAVVVLNENVLAKNSLVESSGESSPESRFLEISGG